MNIKEIDGLDITDSTRNDEGYLTSITVDLGTIEYLNEVISQSCSISLDMGDLAMTISGFDKEQQWPATFQINGFESTGVQTAAPEAWIRISTMIRSVPPWEWHSGNHRSG